MRDERTIITGLVWLSYFAGPLVLTLTLRGDRWPEWLINAWWLSGPLLLGCWAVADVVRGRRPGADLGVIAALTVVQLVICRILMMLGALPAMLFSPGSSFA